MARPNILGVAFLFVALSFGYRWYGVQELANSPLQSAAGTSSAMTLARSKNCFGCHDLDKKFAGPAFKEIAKKYKGDSEAPAALTNKVLDGGFGTWGIVEKPPLRGVVTREEAYKIVLWILEGTF